MELLLCDNVVPLDPAEIGAEFGFVPTRLTDIWSQEPSDGSLTIQSVLVGNRAANVLSARSHLAAPGCSWSASSTSTWPETRPSQS
jgi:hypothetical protein